MDGIAETLENVGLAQEINNGLAASLQKAPKWSDFQPAIDAKKAEYTGKGILALKDDAFVMTLLKEWAAYNGTDLSMARRRSSAGVLSFEDAKKIEPTDQGLTAAWETFTTTGAATGLDVLCRYSALRDQIAKQPIEEKQFYEARPLGKGAFGIVHLVFKKDTCAPFATKSMHKKIAKQNKMLNDVIIEREVLAKIKSNFCVNINYAFHTPKELFLTITLMPGGDLGFLLQSNYTEAKKKEDRKFKKLPPGAVKFYAASMAMGLDAIHKAGYVYRDLKPQNVLLDVEGQVRISDMGLAADISGGPIKQCSGTRGYWSPETIKKEKYTIEPDWWSLGVTMYVLESDKMPFSRSADGTACKSDEEKDAATVGGVIAYTHDEPADLQGIINDLCKIDQKARLGCTSGLEELKKHPYFAGFDWYALSVGAMPAPQKPNPNDINAPSKKDIQEFKDPPGVDWTAEDEARFDSWKLFDQDLWAQEALFRIKKKKEFPSKGGGGGGGGCCVIA